MLYTVYRGLTDLAAPLVPYVLERRRAAGKEDPDRQGERLGLASRARPAGRLIWVHGASVGEALSAQVLIRRALAADPAATVLLTTGTVTSAAMMAERLPDRAIHQFVPVDRMPFVRRFMDHWRPDLAVWIESEIWPNLLTEIGRRGLPAVLVNARMSARSFARWRHFPVSIARLLGVFSLVLPWDESEAGKLRALGAAAVGPAGNLKYAAGPPAADEGALARLRRATAGRPVWLAASTHPGEEEICATVHCAVAAAVPDLLTVVVPRHPHRGAAIEAALADQGLVVARRSADRLPSRDTDVYLADTMGEMGLFLRLASAVLVGGSLVPHGGHNPIEPAQLGCPILFGPHMTNFPEIAGELLIAGGAREVPGAADLSEALRGLFARPADRRASAEAAAAVASRNREAIERVLAAVDAFFLPDIRGRAA
jgi:3-deoxy-D-manno-octulosonic-acid transferase